MSNAAVNFDIDFIDAEENLLLDFQYALQGLVTDKQMSRADLAKLAGISKARLSQIFSENANPTLKTCARLFAALRAAPEIRLRGCSDLNPRGVSEWRLAVDEVAFQGKRSESELRFVAAVKESVGASNDNGAQVLRLGFDLDAECEAA